MKLEIRNYFETQSYQCLRCHFSPAPGTDEASHLAMMISKQCVGHSRSEIVMIIEYTSDETKEERPRLFLFLGNQLSSSLTTSSSAQVLLTSCRSLGFVKSRGTGDGSCNQQKKRTI